MTLEFPAIGSTFGTWRVISSKPVPKDGSAAAGCRCSGCGQIKYLGVEELISANPPVCRVCSQKQKRTRQSEWMKGKRQEVQERIAAARAERVARKRQREESDKTLKEEKEERRRLRAAIRERAERMKKEDLERYRKAKKKSLHKRQRTEVTDKHASLARILSVPAPNLSDRLQPSRKLPRFICPGCGMERISTGKTLCRICRRNKRYAQERVCGQCGVTFHANHLGSCPVCYRTARPSSKRTMTDRLFTGQGYLYPDGGDWQELAFRYLEEERGWWENELDEAAGRTRPVPGGFQGRADGGEL